MVITFALLVGLASSISDDQNFCVIATLCRRPDHHPIRIGAERLVAASPVMIKRFGPSWENNYPESSFVIPPRLGMAHGA
jgi:hypothetical protein